VTSQASPARARASLHISDLSPQNCSSLSPGASHAIILPTHDRLYTIINPLKRGTIHIAFVGGRLRIPDTGVKPKFSCREDRRG
jgi:hypothetical protein